MKVEKHFVTFISPGTFMAETSRREIDSWDAVKAKEMAKGIGGYTKPYAFQFITRSREDHELDSTVTASSPTYFIDGTVRTLEEIQAENNKKDKILISNMICNGYKSVVTVRGFTVPVYEDDIVLI